MIADVLVTTSTAVVTWEPVDDPNGLLLNYTIEVSPLRIISGSMNQSVIGCLRQMNRTEETLITRTIDGSMINYTITGLSKG